MAKNKHEQHAAAVCPAFMDQSLNDTIRKFHISISHLENLLNAIEQTEWLDPREAIYLIILFSIA